jgi:hypothetical protein
MTNLTKSTVLRRFRAIERLTGRRFDVGWQRVELLLAHRVQVMLARELQLVDVTDLAVL